MTSPQRAGMATVVGARGSGTAAVLDDGTAVFVPAHALAASPFRRLRAGQRLSVVTIRGPEGLETSEIRPVAARGAARDSDGHDTH